MFLRNTPQNFDSLHGNKNAFQQLQTWGAKDVDRSKNGLSPSSCILIVGPSGVGKTLGCSLLFKKLGWLPYIIHSDNCTNAKELVDHLNKVFRTPVGGRFNNEEHAIFIDEFDTLSSMDRNIGASLLQFLKQNKNFAHRPIICTVQSSYEMKLGDLRKICAMIRLQAASVGDLFLFSENICKQENWCISQEQLLNIARDSRGSYNACLNNLLRLGHRGGGDEMIASKVELQELQREAPSKLEPMPNRTTKPVKPKKNIKADKCEDELDKENDEKNKKRLWDNLLEKAIKEEPWITPLRYHEELPKLVKGTGRSVGVHKVKEKYAGALLDLLVWDQLTSDTDTDLTDEMEDLSREFLLQCMHTHINPANSMSNPDEWGFSKLLSMLSLRKKQQRSSYGVGVDASTQYLVWSWKH